jgi:type IV secretion system protein VirB9
MPTVVCAPLHVCDIALQPGEMVKGVNVGDPVMWDVEPSVSGSGGEARTILVVKPQDAGLRTDLSVATDRRIYAIALVSTRYNYMPLASFTYPDDQARAWAAYQQQFAAGPPGAPNSPGNVYFPYAISGDAPSWRPLRAWSNGQKTFILFAPGFRNYQAGAPVLEAITGGCGLCVFRSPQTATLNYRWDGQYIVYDGVLDQAELVSGQTRVVLTRAGAN